MSLPNPAADETPFLTLGMTVYNSENHLGQALDSLLAQNYNNFQLIISDDASDDGSPQICTEYQSRDARIRYLRNEKNVGFAENLNRLISLASGKYFLYVSDHDLWHSSYISRCVQVLEENPQIVLCYSRTMLIDSNGNEMGLTSEIINTVNMPAAERYLQVLRNIHWCDMQMGVMRTEVIKSLRGFKQILGSDHAVLAEIALKGEELQIDEALYFRRRTRGEEEDKDRDGRYKRIVGPRSSPLFGRSHTRLYCELILEHLIIILRTPLTYREKIVLGLETVYRFASRLGRWGPTLAHACGFLRPGVRKLLPKSH